jgi:hypothetical protein
VCVFWGCRGCLKSDGCFLFCGVGVLGGIGAGGVEGVRGVGGVFCFCHVGVPSSHSTLVHLHPPPCHISKYGLTT